MKRAILNRRDLLKTTVAGTVLTASSMVESCAEQTTPTPSGADSKENRETSLSGAKEGTVIRSDMSECLPSENLSHRFDKDRWQLTDFETVEGVKGLMASARPDHRCGELTLSLDAEGFYRIYLGIHKTKTHYHGASHYGQLEVKLTRDGGFRRVGPEHDTVDQDGTVKFVFDRPGQHNDRKIYNVITEAYWKTADLGGQSLTFRQMPYPYNRPEHATIANLSYVRLEPLNEQEKREWQELQPRDETRRLASIFCTGQYTGHTRGTYTFHPTSKEWFNDEFEPYANSDIKILIFEALRGSSCVYKTSIGSLGTKDNRWQENWVDPLAELTRLAHGNGMKIFASMRFIGPQYPLNVAPIAWAPNYWKHPEWTERNREGAPTTNLSLAFPEVRQYWLSLLRETLDYGTDGVQLHLNRSAPYVLYEEPVVSSFQEKYGEDPRELSSTDRRWLAHSAGYVTRFIREVRALVDEKPGRELGVTITGRKNEPEVHYKQHQCDVEHWLRERLVNYIMVTPYLDVSLLKKWRGIGGDDIHLWPDLMPRAQSAASYAKLAKKYYEAGADGLSLWDGERRTARISEWAAVQRLGHIKQLDRLIEEGPSFYRPVDLKYLGGFDVQWSFRDG